jgi:beta-catenin-like protein 1
LSHENADIVIDVVEVVHELTDEDVVNEVEEEEDDQSRKDRGSEEALKLLVDELVSEIPCSYHVALVIDWFTIQLKNAILELLVQNLTRLNESEESDREGVFHILGEDGGHTRAHCIYLLTSVLGIFENCLGFNPELSTRLVSDTKILPWLLERISVKSHDENQGYAAEVLSILLQDNRDNRLALGSKGGVETLLKILSVCGNCLPGRGV